MHCAYKSDTTVYNANNKIANIYISQDLIINPTYFHVRIVLERTAKHTSTSL